MGDKRKKNVYDKYMCQDVVNILPLKWQEVSYLSTPIEIHIEEYFSCHFVCLYS